MSQRSSKLPGGMTGPDQSILNLIHEDMEVYDVNNEHVGEVDFVYLGSAGPAAAHYGTGPQTVDNIDLFDNSLVEVIAEAFGDNDIPDVIRKRLLYYGFIRIDTEGLFGDDRYVMGDKIARVDGENVYLSITREQMIDD